MKPSYKTIKKPHLFYQWGDWYCGWPGYCAFSGRTPAKAYQNFCAQEYWSPFHRIPTDQSCAG